MLNRRTNARDLGRVIDRVERDRWAAKREAAAQGAPLLARMDAAGVNSLAELYALEAR